MNGTVKAQPAVLSMTPEQALQMIGSVLPQMALPWADHVKLQRALEILSQAIKEGK